MKAFLKATVLTGVVLGMVGCYGGDVDRPDFPGTKEGAKELVKRFVEEGADYRALTLQLKPADEDYETYFVESVVPIAKKNYYSQIWFPPESAFKPMGEGETEVLLFDATLEELQNNTGQAPRYPEGYDQIAHLIKGNPTIYMFEFVRPGETEGTKHDGLVYINDHWAMFPSPWRFVEE
ncbi:MAG: hypothetical protein GF419_00605 [Ignavibacteriales bacterium]|nr:hypothetical protein [Ignavibacteriales bacterium]